MHVYEIWIINMNLKKEKKSLDSGLFKEKKLVELSKN